MRIIIDPHLPHDGVHCEECNTILSFYGYFEDENVEYLAMICDSCNQEEVFQVVYSEEIEKTPTYS